MAFKMRGNPFKQGYQEDLIERSIKTTKGAELSGQTKSQNRAVKTISSGIAYKSAFKQTDGDLKEFLMSEKGFNQEDADRMMSDGAYDLNNKEFKKWFETSSKSDNQKPPKDVDGDTVPLKNDPKKARGKKKLKRFY
tara:strand:- start:44 stop:454 length:411 start_codon:yes stop_codon:yes gene_type:complete